MNKTKIAFIASVVFIIMFFYVYYCFCLCYPHTQKGDNLQNKTNINTEKEGDISKVCFNEKCFNVEIADTPKKHAQGLMNRKSLDQDSGMLFLFDTEAKYCFWMKNTLIPLDIIWLDKNKRVVFIKHDAKPCQAEPCKTFRPDEKAKYVFEINSGFAKKIGLREGDEMKFKLR